MIEGHGDDLHRYDGRVKINFSSNIFSGFDHTALMRHLFSSGDILSFYPEPDAAAAKSAIAEMEGVSADCVCLGNGATEIIYNIATVTEGKKSVIAVPTFREYQDACRMFRHTVIFTDADMTSLENSPDADCIWLCNPNNPTGSAYPDERLCSLIASRPATLFIIDQAYRDYCVKPVMRVEDAVSAGNVIMLCSLTKRFAVPGLRIGYGVASPEIISLLESRKQPWSVNSPAQIAVPWLADHREDYMVSRQELHSEALRISRALQEMGLKVSSTDCNFVLVELPRFQASELKDYLVSEHGILIRDASNFERLDQRYFRVAAQRRQDNDKLLAAIESWILSM